jgi:hypothetical protein
VLKKLVHYYKDCYSADNRERSIPNFFANSIEGQFIFDGEAELLTQHLPYRPIPFKQGHVLLKTIELHKKEKYLVFGALFIVGPPLMINGRERSICAPLLYYPAELLALDDDESVVDYYVKPDLTQLKVNVAILKAIARETQEDGELDHNLLKAIPKGKIDFGNIGMIIRAFERYLPAVDTSELLLYPKLENSKAFKRKLQPARTRKLKRYSIYSSAAVGILQKSQETRGILDELTALSLSDSYSVPIQNLFGQNVQSAEIDTKPRLTPTILSAAQKQAIDVANAYPMSMIIGPPGTGKSYTISAMAMEQISQGKSVLIVSKNDEAIDVIADKIERQLKVNGVTVRAGRKDYLKRLKADIQKMLNMRNTGSSVFSKDSIDPEKEIWQVTEDIRAKEEEFRAFTEDELAWGKFLDMRDQPTHVMRNFQKKFQNHKQYSLKHWELLRQLYALYDKRNDCSQHAIEHQHDKWVSRTLKHNRSTLRFFLNGLRARTGERQERMFARLDFEKLLNTFPIWLVKLTDLYRVLPLQQELFDLVIIDEATQCDIASCLPALQRAKRAVICGDPKQLRHVSFLARKRQRALQAKHELQDFNPESLDYRDKSILDLVNDSLLSQDQVTFLNEHFRSQPQIIHFSNKHYYGESLHIMTQRPKLATEPQKVKAASEHALQLRYLPEGERAQNGTNKHEALTLIEEVRELIASQLKVEAQHAISIGILSPFRAQVELISKLLQTSLTIREIEKHRIVIGTAFSFQGEERDVMLLSIVVDKVTNASAFTYMQRDDVFNVSITRARFRQIVFHSVQPNDLKFGSTLHKFLSQEIGKLDRVNTDVAVVDDDFVNSVKETLEAHGITVWPAFPMTGTIIDLMAKYEDNFVAIDLIGFPGAFEDAFTFDHYKILSRAGIAAFPLAFAHWKFNRGECLKGLLEAIISKGRT